MKLTHEQIEKITKRIFSDLKEKGLLVFKAPEDDVLRKMTEVFAADIKAEADLDKEVEEMLAARANELNAGRVDYRKMFGMIKAKLAKERGIVL